MRRAWIAFLLLALPATAQTPEEALANYTKFEYRIPMRDGTKLFTVAYVPKDSTKTYPFLFTRTPYGVGPYGPDAPVSTLSPSPLFWKAGYIFVRQDVRGRMKSEGKFVDMRPHNPAKKDKDFDESTDAYDTLEWLLKNVPGHNGKAGMIGISYPGFFAACGMIDAHPALKAVSPQAPVMDMFDGDDWRHNGALLLAHNFGFEAVFNKMTPKFYSKPGSLDFDYGTNDGYQFFLDMGPLANAEKKHFKGHSPYWKEVMTHPDYDDYAKARDLRPHVKGIKPAVLTVGGWYDAEDLAGTIHCFNRVRDSSKECPQNTLVMGPWVHGGWARGEGDALGPVKFHAKTAPWYREHVELPFFEFHLKDVKPAQPLPTALMFETGTNRWRKFDAWPPKEAKAVAFRFAANGALIDGKPPMGDHFDEYVSDPAKPVPYMEKVTPRMDKEYMTADQRFANRRPDVVSYRGSVLADDVFVAGPVEVELHVSTTGTDSDFVVKLIDVYPDDHPELGSYQQLVRGEPFRGKYRNSLAKPEPFKPGEPAVIRFSMPDVSHCFRSGHRIMVLVQSSWFPFTDRNPQTFCDIGKATEADFVNATQRIYRSEAKPSGVTLRVVGQ